MRLYYEIIQNMLRQQKLEFSRRVFNQKKDIKTQII
jgi:hypothetical protein